MICLQKKNGYGVAKKESAVHAGIRVVVSARCACLKSTEEKCISGRSVRYADCLLSTALKTGSV